MANLSEHIENLSRRALSTLAKIHYDSRLPEFDVIFDKFIYQEKPHRTRVDYIESDRPNTNGFFRW